MTAASGSRTTRVVVSAPPIRSTRSTGRTSTARSIRTRPVSSTGPGSRSPSSPASPTTRPSRAGCGAAPRTTARFASRPRAHRGSTSRAATAVRSSSIRPTSTTCTATISGSVAYRNTDGGAGFFTNSFITGGINLADRSDFYVPEIMNQGNPNQLFLGTYRVYRTDNAKADDAAARSLDRDQPRPHVGLHRRRGEWRARLPDQRARCLERRQRRLCRDTRRLGPVQPRRGDEPVADLDPRGPERLPEPPRQRHRGRSVE